MLHPPQGLKRLNYECEICMLYCLQSWRHISETMSVLNVLESCGLGWLRSIQDVPDCTYLEELILRTRPECPVDPLPHPVQSDWRMLDGCTDHWPHLCNHWWGVSVSWVCIVWQTCQLYDTLLQSSESGGFSWILHFTFHRLLATAVARYERPDRLWGLPNLLFSQYVG
jgi:hypothetical protein